MIVLIPDHCLSIYFDPEVMSLWQLCLFIEALLQKLLSTVT